MDDNKSMKKRWLILINFIIAVMIMITFSMKAKFWCLTEFGNTHAEKLFTDDFFEKVKGILQIDKLVFLD